MGLYFEQFYEVEGLASGAGRGLRRNIASARLWRNEAEIV